MASLQKKALVLSDFSDFFQLHVLARALVLSRKHLGVAHNALACSSIYVDFRLTWFSAEEDF